MPVVIYGSWYLWRYRSSPPFDPLPVREHLRIRVNDVRSYHSPSLNPYIRRYFENNWRGSGFWHADPELLPFLEEFSKVHYKKYWRHHPTQRFPDTFSYTAFHPGGQVYTALLSTRGLVTVNYIRALELIDAQRCVEVLLCSWMFRGRTIVNSIVYYPT